MKGKKEELEKILLSYSLSITDNTSLVNKMIITSRTADKIIKLIS
jgi:hypothetical protein